MKKLSKHWGLIVAVFMGIALFISVVATTVAWYVSQTTVETTNTTLTAAESDNFDVQIPQGDNFQKYMGETGIEYEDDDSPYMLEYTPVRVRNTLKDKDNCYMKCSMSDKSYIEKVVEDIYGSTRENLSKKDLIDNFTFRLVVLESIINEITGETEYVETATVYRTENGYLRNYDTKELLSLEDGKEYYFAMKVYFIGEAGLGLLERTQDDIDVSYKFDYSNEIYMNATFYLFALFELDEMHTISFNSMGYDTLNQPMDATLYTTNSLEDMPTTGASLLTSQGETQTFPVPEITSVETGSVDYSLYFQDWVYVYNATTGSDPEYRVYRSTKSDGVYSLETDFLMEENIYLHSRWANSPTLILDYVYEENLKDYVYLRPKSNYYTNKGYVVYNTNNKSLSVYNPSGIGEPQLIKTIPMPKREGYIFKGWGNSASATTPNVFTQANQYKIDTARTLYAIWIEATPISVELMEENWGGNVNLSNISIMFGEDSLTITEGVATAYGIAGETLFDTLKLYSATATITRNGQSTTTTAIGWCYYNGESCIKITESNKGTVTYGVRVKPIWDGRQSVAVTLDLKQVWGLTGGNKAYFNITAVDLYIDGYQIMFDSNGTKSASINFTATDSNESIVVYLPEGIVIGEETLPITIASQDIGFGGNEVSNFHCWSTSNNNMKKAMSSINVDAYTEPIGSAIKLYLFYLDD